MNRIILIGNGFDLAHGLKTSYQNFLDNYWIEWYDKLRGCKDWQISDGLYRFEGKSGDEYKSTIDRLLYSATMHIIQYGIQVNEKNAINSFHDLSTLCDYINSYWENVIESSDRIHHHTVSPLFEKINNSYLQKWVDIENEYYCLLKSYLQLDNRSEAVEKLHNEFNIIKILLEKYLSAACDMQTEANPLIKDIFERPIRKKEIANCRKEMLVKEIMAPRMLQANYPQFQMSQALKECDKHLKEAKPSRTLFLNFNYTDTAKKLYGIEDRDIINIHGELNNKDNPLIFGYGDELDEDHKNIVNLNDNLCLKNIKSINYLITNNYRRLLDFISSEPYQIYVMGHSCGNSDRTLLNTLFEHNNCISIKPFYYIDENGEDNYIEIFQNIYRNFTDMALVRDIVVNKRYCEPLPQNKIEV